MTKKDLVKIDKRKIVAAYAYEDYYFEAIEECEGAVGVWVRQDGCGEMNFLFGKGDKTTKKCMKGLKKDIAIYFERYILNDMSDE